MPMQVNELGAQDGDLTIVGAEPGEPDTRPSALLPFPAPVDSAYTVSAEIVDFDGRIAIGFSDSNATAATSRPAARPGSSWTPPGGFVTGGNTGILHWTFHTDGLSGSRARRRGDRERPSVPYTARPISYMGEEGTLLANVDNFTVRAGTVTDPPPAAVAPPGS